MVTPPLVITVFGTAAPQGSKRGFANKGGGVSMVESSKQLRPWRQDVKYAAMDALANGANGGFGAAPVNVAVDFYFPRPLSHYRTGRNSDLLRDNAPPRPISARSGDIDKLTRACLDALTDAGVWKDDAQVVSVRATKWYVGLITPIDRPGCVIRVQAIT